MDARRLNVIFSKNGQGRTSTKITLPLPWVKEMGLTEENREVQISFVDDKIIIEKISKDKFDE